MFRTIVIAGLLIASPATGGQVARALVCPPHLSYCYYDTKPIEPRMRAEDQEAEIWRMIDGANRRIERQDREMLRRQYLDSLTPLR